MGTDEQIAFWDAVTIIFQRSKGHTNTSCVLIGYVALIIAFLAQESGEDQYNPEDED